MDLPLLQEFLLDLVNNNYSEHTIESYRRDMEIFAAFLDDQQLEFSGITKLGISKYKEFLRNGRYLDVIRSKRKVKTVAAQSDPKKSSQKASRRLSMYSGRT